MKYQAMHGLGLLLLAVLYDRLAPTGATLAYLGMLCGVLIFSGTLYALVLTGIKWLGAITPIGGVLLIASWVVLAFSYKKAAM